MFGYVRPLKCELKLRQFEEFKAEYCGLCHELRRRYGHIAAFFLNYDLTVLSMLLATGPTRTEECRCYASPFHRKKVCAASGNLSEAAALGVILSYRKLRDSAQDEGFFKSLFARILSLLLRRAYKKAARERPEFDKAVSERLGELDCLEKSGCESLDMAADCFAGILKAAAAGHAQERTLGELLYHLGRWVYIVDALDDLKEDIRSGRFNPIASRFKLTFPELPESVAQAVLTTLRHSNNLCVSAFNLMKCSDWTDILENIFYLGMPATALAVREGRWKKDNRRKHE
jgi:hypothetical protein